MPTLPEGWESQFVRSEREDTIATVVMLILVGLAILAVVIK